MKENVKETTCFARWLNNFFDARSTQTLSGVTVGDSPLKYWESLHNAWHAVSPKKRLGVTVISTVWSNVSLKIIVVVVAEPQNIPFHTTANLGSRSVTEACSRHLPEEETEAQRHALAGSGAEPGTLAQLAAGARFFLLLKVGLASYGRPDGPEPPKALTFMTAKAGGHRDSTRESMVSSKETGGEGPRPTGLPRSSATRNSPRYRATSSVRDAPDAFAEHAGSCSTWAERSQKCSSCSSARLRQHICAHLCG